MPKPKDKHKSRKGKRKCISGTEFKYKHKSSTDKQKCYKTLKRKHTHSIEKHKHLQKKKSRKHSSSSSSSSTSLSSISSTSSSSSSDSRTSSSSTSSSSSSNSSSLSSGSSVSRINYSFNSSRNDSERMDAYYPYSELQFSDRPQYALSSMPPVSQSASTSRNSSRPLAAPQPIPSSCQSRATAIPVLPSTSRSQTAPPQSKSSAHADLSQKDELLRNCPICMDKLGRNAVASTMCGHIFCLKCVQVALKQSGKACPTCRKKLSGVGYHQLFL